MWNTFGHSHHLMTGEFDFILSWQKLQNEYHKMPQNWWCETCKLATNILETKKLPKLTKTAQFYCAVKRHINISVSLEIMEIRRQTPIEHQLVLLKNCNRGR